MTLWTLLTMNGLNGGHVGLAICLAISVWLVVGIGRQPREQREPEQEPEYEQGRAKYEQAAAEFEIHSTIAAVDD